MWRRTVLVILVVLYKHISSQPITEDNRNDRPPRQLDFEECCPCADIGQSSIRNDGGYQEPLAAGSEGVFFGPRDVDDCPCRFRYADTQGASSVFFPTAMRTAGSFLRPGDKKEDLKPIFNPEVDLASSVLQTLREATDEEYEDALARDAAKSAVRAAENIVFGDATPEESANIVTIVVNPKVADDSDDVIPQASHIQSRCIHPSPSARTNIVQMRVVPKSNLILHKPRSSKIKPTGLLHRNMYEIDNGVGASNVHEQVISFDEDTGESYSSSVKSNPIVKSAVAKVNPDVNCDVGKVPDFRSASAQNKINNLDLGKSSLLQSIRDKTLSSLSRVPKLKFGSLLRESRKNNEKDLSTQPSTIHEKSARKDPNPRTNLLFEGIKNKSSPLSLTNLLNLKDVEMIPLKELINKSKVSDNANKPNPIWPSVLSSDDSEISTKKEVEDTESIENSESDTKDPEVSPSLVNIQVNWKDAPIIDENCEQEKSDLEENENEINSNVKNKEHSKHEYIIDDNCDKGKPKADIETMSKETEEVIFKANNNEETNSEHADDGDCNEGASEFMSNTQSKEVDINEINIEALDSSSDVKQVEESAKVDTDCRNDENNDSSELRELNENETNVIEEEIPKQDGEEKNDKSPKIFDKLKLLDTISVDKTINNIKENIAKKLEDLKNHRKNVQNQKIMNKDDMIREKDNEEPDCDNGASIQVTTQLPVYDLDEPTTTLKPYSMDNHLDVITTVNPDLLVHNAKDATECSDKVISLQDLQNMSNSMLQQEEERERESKALECNDPESEVISENNTKNAEVVLPDSLSETKTAQKVEPMRPDGFQGKNYEDLTCKTDSNSEKSTLVLQSDTNFGASDIIENEVIEPNNILGSQLVLEPQHLNILKNPLNDLNDTLKMPPLDPSPLIDDIKVKFNNLFDKNNKNEEHVSPLKTKPEPLKLDNSNLPKVMATEASTSNFQSRTPPSRLLKNVNLDFLDLRPRSTKLSDIPTLSSHSFNTNLPLPKDLNINPVKLQSVLEDTRDLLGNTLSLGKKSNLIGTEKSKLPDSFDSPLEATNNIHSALKKTHKTIESRFRQAVDNVDMLRNPIQSNSLSLLESASKRHEDISEKLKALHMDFNDRIQTMHNEFVDRTKLLTTHSKPNFRTSSSFGKQEKNKQPSKHSWKASNRREPQRTWTTRKAVQQKQNMNKNSPSNNVQQKRFKMPAAASVPVPRTIKVPELKSTSVNSAPLTLQRGSKTITNKGTSQQMDSFRNLRQPINTLQSPSVLLGKQLNQKKEDKIKVTFSTTPRPVISGHKFRSAASQLTSTGEKIEKLEPRKLYEHYKESPSEMRYFKTALDSDSVNKPKHIKMQTKALSKTVVNKEPNVKLSETGKLLQTWPRDNENPLLIKVREAVQTKLLNGPKSLKQSAIHFDKGNKVKEVSDSKLDMARSPSENSVVIHEPTLKENVSYKCKLVCTKEQDEH